MIVEALLAGVQLFTFGAETLPRFRSSRKKRTGGGAGSSWKTSSAWSFSARSSPTWLEG